MLSKVICKFMRKIFFAIDISKNLNSGLKHIFDKVVKLFEDGTYFRFVFHKIGPTYSCVIINKGNKPSCSSKVRNSGTTPYVTMNEVNWF